MTEVYTDPLGHEWYVLKGATMNEIFQGMSGAKHYEPEEEILIPKRASDDYKAFPAGEEVKRWGGFFQSGTAFHKVNVWDWKPEMERGLSAVDLEVFNETDWYGECFQVLQAHGWLGRQGGVSDSLLNAVTARFGISEIERAKEQCNENWTARIYELGATFLCDPFSRLWYAANMYSLYYCHHDDLRLGYLWSEYSHRMSHEVSALRGRKTHEAARAGGLARAKVNEGYGDQRISLMQAYVARGHTISRAAQLAARSGVGASAEANRKAWQRYNKE